MAIPGYYPMTYEEAVALSETASPAEAGAPTPETDPLDRSQYARTLTSSERGTGPHHLIDPPDRMIEAEMEGRPGGVTDFFEGRAAVARSIKADLWDRASGLLERDPEAYANRLAHMSSHLADAMRRYEHQIPFLKGRVAVISALNEMCGRLGPGATVEDAATRLTTLRNGAAWAWVPTRGSAGWGYEVERFDRMLPPEMRGRDYELRLPAFEYENDSGDADSYVPSYMRTFGRRMTLEDGLKRLSLLGALITPMSELIRTAEALEYELYVYDAVRRHYEVTGTTVLFPDEASSAAPPEISEEESAHEEAPAPAQPDPSDPANWNEKTRDFIKAAYARIEEDGKRGSYNTAKSVTKFLVEVGKDLGYRGSSTLKRLAVLAGVYEEHKVVGAPKGELGPTRLREFKQRVRQAHALLQEYEQMTKKEA